MPTCPICYYVIGVYKFIVEEILIQASPHTAFLVLKHGGIGEAKIAIRIDEFTGGTWLSYVSINGNPLCQVPVVEEQDLLRGCSLSTLLGEVIGSLYGHAAAKDLQAKGEVILKEMMVIVEEMMERFDVMVSHRCRG